MRKSLRSYLLDEWNILMRLFRMALSRMALSRMALSRMALSRMALSQTTLGLIMLAQPALAGGSATIDRTEVTIGGFAEFADTTGIITKAEKAGGMVFEAGWVVKRGWTWRTPYGVPGPLDEPAVHITYDEAAAYCQWRGGRLPTRDEWIEYAYTEMRDDPPPPFVTGKTYPYPTGDSPDGANCLRECGNATGNPRDKIDHSEVLMRGHGHASAGSTAAGVNGVHDMGANVWEWATLGDGQNQATMGGSWWYGATQMAADYGATKPRDMAVVYIGFRCISDGQ
jgi:formylglycine-generating enzyme required for sulfatase activity